MAGRILHGNRFQFTWSLTEEGPTQETIGYFWMLSERVLMHNTTPASTDGEEEYTEGTRTFKFRARFRVSTGAMPLPPIGAIGSGVAYPNQSGGTGAYTMTMRADRMMVVAVADRMGEPDIVEFEFQGTQFTSSVGEQTAALTVTAFP